MTSARLPGLDMEHSNFPGIFQDDPVDVFWVHWMPRCHLSLRQGSPRMQIQPIDLLTKRSQRDSWGFCDGALSPTVRVASPGDWTYKRVPWPTFSAFLKTSDRSSGYGMHIAAASAKQARPWELEQMNPKNNWSPVPSDWSPVSRWCVADAGCVPCRAPWTRLRRVLAAWCAHNGYHCYHPFLGVPWVFLKWGIRKTMAFNTKMLQFRMMWCATPCFRHLHMLVVIFTILYSSISVYVPLALCHCCPFDLM